MREKVTLWFYTFFSHNCGNFSLFSFHTNTHTIFYFYLNFFLALHRTISLYRVLNFWKIDSFTTFFSIFIFSCFFPSLTPKGLHCECELNDLHDGFDICPQYPAGFLSRFLHNSLQFSLYVSHRSPSLYLCVFLSRRIRGKKYFQLYMPARFVTASGKLKWILITWQVEVLSLIGNRMRFASAQDFHLLKDGLK